MTSLIKELFNKWTQGLDTRDSMVSIFTHIRDIPYSLTMPESGYKSSIEQLLAAGKGSCGPKHYLLAEMFRKLNLSVVYATIPFLWDDPYLDYPPRLREMAKALPIGYHLACRVQIGCHWVLVDATWDRLLASAGFPVNDQWDGYSETRCAVKSFKSPVPAAWCQALHNKPPRTIEDFCKVYDEKDHWHVEDQDRFYRRKAAIRTPDEMIRLAAFYRDFESWIIGVRHHKQHFQD